MKLKHKWPAIIIWVLFVIFDVLMVAGSGFTSGLFPNNVLLYTAVLTVLGVAVVNVITFFLGKMSDSKEIYKASDKKACNVIYTVMMVVIVIGAYITRFFCLANSNADISGQISLYKNAVIGGTEKVPDNGLLSMTFSKILSGILLFTGNRPSVAYIFSAVLSCIFIIITALAIKLLLGKLASLVYAGYIAFMPAFYESFLKLELTTDPLFLCMFGIELLFVAIYLRKASDGEYEGGNWTAWYILVGAVIGFMGYVDAGTFVVNLPLVISTLFIFNSTIGKEFVRLVFILAGALLAFFGMLFQEGGVVYFSSVFDNWHRYFFHNVNTFDTFWTYTDYKIVYLVTVIVMSGVFVGFWKNRDMDRVSPFLFSMLVLFATTPLMGATKMNSQLMISVFYGIILACVAALIVMEPVPIEEYDEEELEDDYEEGGAGVKSYVVTPETYEDRQEEAASEEYVDEHDIENSSDDYADERDINSEEQDINAAEEEISDEREDEAEILVDETKAEDEDYAEEDEDNKATVKEERFVPEGMVLPEETEADSDVVRHERPKKRLPKFEGMISLNRKEDDKYDNKETSEREYKDDFDIQFDPDDDFDL